MKFENFEVQQMYYELHRKYGITHTNHGHEFDNRKFTYDDLIDLEEDFKRFKELIEKTYPNSKGE